MAGAAPQGSRPSAQLMLKKNLVLALVLVVTVAVAATVSYYVGNNFGYNLGYSKGYFHGSGNGQAAQIIQAGTYMPLSPGAEFRVEILRGAIGNFTVSGTIEFTILPYLQANATAEVYVQHYLTSMFNTSYVEIEHNANFTLRLDAIHPTTIVVKANPQNQENIIVFWNSPLLLNIQPPYPFESSRPSRIEGGGGPGGN